MCPCIWFLETFPRNSDFRPSCVHMLDANSPCKFYSLCVLRARSLLQSSALLSYPMIAVGCDGTADCEVSLQNLLPAATQGTKDRTNYR